MMQIVEQTHEEKMAIYMKQPKKKLAQMLIECNRIIDEQLQAKNTASSHSRYKMFELSEFSSYMINYRNDLKISLRTAAKQIGISASSLSRIEHCKFTPDLETYYKCCKWMKYPMFFNY